MLRHRANLTLGAAPVEPPPRALAEIRQALGEIEAGQKRMQATLLRAERRTLEEMQKRANQRWKDVVLPVGLSIVGSLGAAYMIGHWAGLRRALGSDSEGVAGPRAR